MAFQDLSDLLDPTLDLPIQGKVYRVPPVDAETGLRFQRMHDWALGVSAATQADTAVPAPDTELLDDAAELDLTRASLGSAYEEMFADGVPYEYIRIAGLTSFINVVQGRDAAEKFWKAGGRPEPSAGNRAARRAARSTPRPGSPSGTSRTRQAGKATAGGKSSTTGR